MEAVVGVYRVRLPVVEMPIAPFGYECAGLHGYVVLAGSAGTARPGRNCQHLNDHGC